MKRFRLFFSLALAASLLFPQISQADTVPSLSPGDLIKGRPSTVYFYGSDGRRYVFPNEKTFFTWYPDFRTVKILSDAELAAIPLGSSNITYRPGSRLVKVESNNQVYAVDRGGFLRPVASEQMAESLYGINWKNLTEDIPAVFFPNYKIGAPIVTTFDYKPSDVLTLTSTIAQDKFLPASTITVAIDEAGAGFVPSSFTVPRGSTVVWESRDQLPHTLISQSWASDEITLDKSFSKTFNVAGTYTYSDALHQAFRGTINVTP